MTEYPLRRPSSLDKGRLLFLPVCAFVLGLAVLRLLSGATVAGGSALVSVGVTGSTVLTIGFYALVIRAYLARPPARASSVAVRVNTAALVATPLPVVVPLLRGSTTAVAPVLAGDVLLLVGLGWSVWAMRTLGRSISVIPQARAVVSSGPYRLVRHPLYLGEIVAMLGLAILHPSAATFASWLLLCLLQLYRAAHEERLLSWALPGYGAYRDRTRRLVPGLY